MKINEIFKSLQGESTYSGFPCTFVRLTGCNLRCSWCDTKYSYEEGIELTVEEVVKKIESFDTEIIEFTGGEPLLQKDELLKVIYKIIAKNSEQKLKRKILLETNGSISLEKIPESVVKIVDIKLPSSNEGKSFDYNNLKLLNKTDEIKFVVSDKKDYNTMKSIIKEKKLNSICDNILVSKVSNSDFPHSDLTDLIIKDSLNVRYQLQIHKYIWNDARGK